MELRSSRSRSNTPLIRASLEEDVQIGNHVERMRSTRSTTIKYETTTSGSSNTLKPSKPKSTKSQTIRYKTSDYSSEDGEQEVSSSGHPTDDTKYQKHKLSTNGGAKISALKVYKEAGEYWNKFPKTDYTYSRHSKDRVELAPGVVAMPNMSRRSLHSSHSSEERDTSNKETNTESYENDDDIEYTLLQARNMRFRPRTLFTNNNYEENREYMMSGSSTYRQTFYSKFLTSFINIILILFYPFGYAYNVQYTAMLYLGKKVHAFVSKVMFLDTWLLQRSTSNNKIPAVVGLCLIPLLLFGGWWLITGLCHLMYGILYGNGTTPLPLMEPLVKTETPILNNYEGRNLYGSDHNHIEIPTVDENVEITEKVALDNDEIHLSHQQLQNIINAVKSSINSEQFDTDTVIKKVLESPSIHNVIKNNNFLNSKLNDNHFEYQKGFDNQKLIIDTLKDEITKIRNEFTEIVSQLQENAKNNIRFANKLNTCCRRSFLQIEGYVTKILGDLLGAPGYINNQEDISKWLHSIFVAKKDLELRLTNLTHNLKSEYDLLIENNGKRIMDDVASKITTELHKRTNQNLGEINIGNVESISDEHIKQIVGEALSIYDADKTGLVDFALETSGGQIVSTRCTESYQLKTAVFSLFGIPLWYPSNTPRVVITPGVNPGECWAFQNFPGFLVIRLSAYAQIEAFTMEHVSKKLILHGQFSSAPKDFEVYGLHNETDREPMLLGKYVYNYDDQPLQYFPAQKMGLVYNLVELRILSNHGNPNFTCLYRFRVHGTLSTEPT